MRPQPLVRDIPAGADRVKGRHHLGRFKGEGVRVMGKTVLFIFESNASNMKLFRDFLGPCG